MLTVMEYKRGKGGAMNATDYRRMLQDIIDGLWDDGYCVTGAAIELSPETVAAIERARNVLRGEA
jgi:hypothetical protein